MDDASVKLLMKRLGERADELGIDYLSEEQKNVLLPWVAFGEIGNGGFQFLFEGEILLSGVAPRFRILGLEAIASACEEVSALLFPDGQEPRGAARRDQLVDSVEWDAPAIRQRERLINEVSWDDMTRAIGAYVDAHPEVGTGAPVLDSDCS